MSAPMRSCDQTLSVLAAVVGGILLHTARRTTPGAPSVQGITKRKTTGARLRGARWGRAAHAPMERRNVPTAEGLTGQGRMPVLPRGKPGGRLGGGARHPQRGGRRAGNLRYPRSEPRPPTGKRRVRRRLLSRRRKGPLRRPWRWRIRDERLCFHLSFLFFLLMVFYPFPW